MEQSIAKAIVCSIPNGPYEVQDVRIGAIRRDEIAVRMVATGVCHTDFACSNGTISVPLPLIAGHEGAGIVEGIGADVSHLTVGDHVILSFSSCGNCVPCRRGKPAYCTRIFAMNFKGSRTDGTKAFTSMGGDEISSHFFGQSSFSNVAIARASSAVKVDKGLPLQTLCSLGCSMQTGAGTILNVLKPYAGSSVVIFGVGAVGMGAVMAANITSATVIIAVDIHESKLEKAKALGATHAINSRTADVVEQIKTMTGGYGGDFAIDTTGKIPAIEAMIKCAAPGGLVATVGSPRFGEKIEIEPASWLARGVSYVGVHQGSSNPQEFIPILIQLWQSGRLPVERLIQTYPYTDIQKAKSDLESGKCSKAVLLWD